MKESLASYISALEAAKGRGLAIDQGRIDTLKKAAARVVTEHVYPPIPDRSCDWAAWYERDHKDQPDCGWGPTEQAAITDLLDSYDEPIS